MQDFISAKYEVTCDGLTCDSGKIDVPDVKPHSDGEVDLKVKIPAKGKVFLKVTYLLKKEMKLIPNGYVLGFDEVKMSNDDSRNQNAVKWLEQENKQSDIDVMENDTQVILKGKSFSYIYNKKNGMFDSMVFAGREYLEKPMEINIWRAPTDNDMYIKLEWKKAKYDDAYVRAYQTRVEQSGKGVRIVVKSSVSAATIQKILDVVITWDVDCNGAITSSMEVVKDSEFPDLPRFGLRLFLNKQLEDVTYYGMGPQESYRDKHRASSHGMFKAKVFDMHEDYIRPQENGSHFDCDYVEITNGQFGFTAVSEKSFSFNASVYTQEELEKADHNYMLEATESTVLCIDYALNGIGSNSCGPVVLDKYRFNDVEFDFTIKLIPYVKE